MDDIPNELFFEIFLFAQIDTLSRFKSVKRRFYEILQHKHFWETYLLNLFPDDMDVSEKLLENKDELDVNGLERMCRIFTKESLGSNFAWLGSQVRIFLKLMDVGVGKSSILTRYVRVEESTIGAAFLTRNQKVFNLNMKFETWDTAGQERYRSLAPMYYRGAYAIVIVYDITNTRSFTEALRYRGECNNMLQQASKRVGYNPQNHPTPVYALVGNKIDLEQSRAVDREEAEESALEKDFDLFMETSALNGANVEKLFERIGELILKKSPNQFVEDQIERVRGDRVQMELVKVPPKKSWFWGLCAIL